jgi:hypothetical protein
VNTARSAPVIDATDRPTMPVTIQAGDQRQKQQ